MRCPKCGYEPRNRLLSSPCPNKACSYTWWDTEDYVRMVAGAIQDQIRTVLDIGCGCKGVIAQAYWEQDAPEFRMGFACDIHVIKPLPACWKPLKRDAATLPDILTHVDFITHCGLLEHIPYAHALQVLRVLEELSPLGVFCTMSAVLREVEWKSRQDGNPYHQYRSWWDAKTFELLGYFVDRERMADGRTFCEEVTAWRYAGDRAPWEDREEAVVKHLCNRRCALCDREPVMWDARGSAVDGSNDLYYCLTHALEDNRATVGAPLKRWVERIEAGDDLMKSLRSPPWREKWPRL